MNTKEAIQAAMDVSSMVFNGYISDLEDGELMNRPGEGCNHLAWQIGHLIASEGHLLNSVCPGKACELPEGFAEAHGKENTSCDDASQFKTRDEYLSLMSKSREATKAALNEMSDEQFDAEAPEDFRSFCPTVGHMFVLIATHPMMHAGQCVPVRRQLNKPVMF